jgi:hypothetical protein
MLVMLIAAAKLLAVKAGTSIDPAHLPCWPACLVFWFNSLWPLLVLALVEVDFLRTNLP